MTIEDPRPIAGSIDAGKQSRAEQGLPIIPALDGFRALAIFAIVFLHLVAVFVSPTDDLGRIITYGPLPNAVDVLFILSGFVVFLPTVARGGRFGPVIPYGIRRAARLLPAFWMVIAIVLVMIAVWPTSPLPPTPSLIDVGAHVTGMHMPFHLFDSDFPLGLGINGPLWTLSLEVIFYLLLPLIAVAYYRHPFIGLLIAIAVTVGWKLGAANIAALSDALGFAPTPERLIATSNAAYGQFPSFAVQFALGMTAAWLFVELPRRFPQELLRRRAVLVQGLSLVALVPLCYLFGRFALDAGVLAPTRARSDILLTLAIPIAITAFMLATALAPRRLQLPFALPAARSLGDISYGVYLIHFPLILFYGALFAGASQSLIDVASSFWVAAPLILALSIGYGFLSGRYLEQPIRRWAHRYGSRAQASAQSSPVGSGKPAEAAGRR